MAPRHPADPERLQALFALDLLDSAPEQEYDDLVTLAAAICGTPVAVFNLVDDHRQWGKALVGLASSEAPLEHSFCARTIAQPDGTLVVGDTALDPRFADNPMVVLDQPGMRFYAGASVTTDDGHRLGTVCVADHVPRELTEDQLDALRALARQAGAQLDLRRRTRELQERNAELRHLALHDALTGLPNRTLVLDRLRHAVARARRSGRPAAVLFCDLDGFKAVNDGHGHERGDAVLCAVAARLTEAARASDTVGRLAGDEFVVVCEDLEGEDAVRDIAARLRAAVARPVGGLAVDVSIGGALWRDGDDAAALLQRADAAMYAVKGAR